MSVQVQVKKSIQNLRMPDGSNRADGDIFTLSDAAYAKLPAAVLACLNVPPILPPVAPIVPVASIPEVDPALSHWRVAVARARAGAGYARLRFYGGSHTVGYGSGGVYWQNGYPRRVAQILESQLGLAHGGTGLICMADNSVPNDPRLVFNIAPVYGSTGWYFRGYGAFGNNQSNGASAQGGAVSTDSQGTLTFTPTETNVTGFGVVYLTGSTSGTFTWQAKQGASVIQSGSVNANGSTGLGRLDVTGLAAGTYSLVLTGPSGSRLSVAYLEAFCGSSGLLVDVIARQGARIADLVDNTTSPVQISSLASAFNIANAAPDMSIFNFLTNDFNWTPQTSLSSFNSNTLLAAQTAQAAGSDIGLANSIPVKARTLVAGELDQSAFSSALAAMAQANNFTFFDTHSRWGGGTNLYPAYSGLYIDNLHSTGVGHYDMASLIAQRLEV